MLAMWGNSLGWSISVLIVAVTLTFVAWLGLTAQSVTPRTEFSRSGIYGNVIALPVPPITVLPMPDTLDAGPIYRRAIDEYRKDPYTYGRFARSGQMGDIQDVPAINILKQATGCRSANLFARDPKQIANLANEKPELEALTTLGACARHAGELIEASDPAEALKLYDAVFSLGAKLYDERLTYAELDAGLTLLAEGSWLIARLDPARAPAAARFDQARKQYVIDRIQPMERIISTIDQPTLEKHAGDVLYFSRNAAERMWRVEAIFSLARYRFNAGKGADQTTALRVLQELANDDDAVIRAAAIAGRDLTQQQYRMLR